MLLIWGYAKKESILVALFDLQSHIVFIDKIYSSLFSHTGGGEQEASNGVTGKEEAGEAESGELGDW